MNNILKGCSSPKFLGRINWFCLVFFFIVFSKTASAQTITSSARSLVERVIPSHASHFEVEELTSKSGKDEFEIESKNDKIVLRGSSGVAVASALYHYLTEYAHCQVTWNGTNLALPAKLPVVPNKISKATVYNFRYNFNYCTFSYSMSWWNWERWQKEIDWMALHGINMPLAITGEEYTWLEVYKDMGFKEDDLKDFFSGPAYFGWFWMGNLDGWGGPLPISWMESHKTLQQQIVKRERELGMKPVLPAFTGHVPAAFKKKFPKAQLKATNWTNGFGDTYILDSQDPMFAEIGKKFLDKQTKLYGTDHLYSADTFNENEPPTDEPEYLSKLSARIYDGMNQADPDAVWVMQGWLFYSDRKFWKAPQIEALLKAVPDDKMILLDLAAEIEPVWKRTGAFYGKPWIWNMLNNFGGNVNLFGRMEGVAKGPAEAWNDPNKKRLEGIGLTMEAIEQNPVIYELTMDHTWRTTPIDLDDWLKKYARNRYGKDDPDLNQAWQILRKTVYNGKEIRDGAESIVTGRPTLDSTTIWTRTKLNYAPEELLPAWDLFVKSAKSGSKTDGFRYDLVDVSRQVLANYALVLHKKWVAAFKKGDKTAFKKHSKEFIDLINDMDALLATRKDFLLGPWIADARKWGNNAEEKALYEQNARDLITLWGDANSPLHEYSNRQWSGLLSDFYRPRWEKFFLMLNNSHETGKGPDFGAFEKTISQWEWKWVNEQKSFPITEKGSSLDTAVKLHTKYRQQISNDYKK
ncbi:alpha-N-acetylglucosaminidase [Dyadobacter sp. LJ419]|uniref:Alpha-N-acetylglucosaminidase n=1 Tax=Dyadobacter chenwenxiniae TaxID=2906456 RepID=A0A9X1PSN5_9BACT|nr:alpha-N-acetylglucosaminidase [Dyadobacter chenwenxiniae]MCF0065749.1 alpha-N-acetylglucosaminidase [Dyadobacter chenwenxiniae]